MRCNMARKRLLEPIHPGEILLEEFMRPMDIINRLAHEIHVSPGRISAIVNGKRAITGRYGASAPPVLGNVVGSLGKAPK